VLKWTKQLEECDLSPPFKQSPVEFKQSLLFPTNIFDLLADEHECYLYADLFEQLDTTSLEAQYSAMGQHAYHPKRIISILIYAYSRGVFSAREIQKRCNEDLSFMYIAQRNCPNFRVLNDFRKDNAAYFHDCFKQTVQLAMELNLASLGHISLDGSKFKASSSKHKAMSYQRLKEAEATLSEEIDELVHLANQCDEDEDRRYNDKTGFEVPDNLRFKESRFEKIKAAREAIEAREQEINPDKPIDGKKQISFADKEARIMGKRGGTFEYAYNAQISVDKDHQIIVGQHISQQANDVLEVESALKQVQAATGRLPDIMSLDNGYLSGDNLGALEKTKIDAYIATDRGEKLGHSRLEESTRKLVKADFIYDEVENNFSCPREQKLKLVKKSKRDHVYQGDAAICDQCHYQVRCGQSRQGKARTIYTDDKEALRQRMNVKMRQTASKEVYRDRKIIVEPKFGHIKNGGFRGFSLRGLTKVAGEFALVCAVHNIKKIVKTMMTEQILQEA